MCDVVPDVVPKLKIVVMGPKKFIKAESFRTLRTDTLPASVAAITELGIAPASIKVRGVKDPVKRGKTTRRLLVTISGVITSSDYNEKVLQLLAGIVLYELVRLLGQSGTKYGRVKVESVPGAFWVYPPRAQPETLAKMLSMLDTHLGLLEERIEIPQMSRRQADDDERLARLEESRQTAQDLKGNLCGVISFHAGRKILRGRAGCDGRIGLIAPERGRSACSGQLVLGIMKPRRRLYSGMPHISSLAPGPPAQAMSFHVRQMFAIIRYEAGLILVMKGCTTCQQSTLHSKTLGN